MFLQVEGPNNFPVCEHDHTKRDIVIFWQNKKQAKAEYKAAIAILALHRWNLEKGEYPEGLNELVEAGFLEELPGDPYSYGALVYKRTDGDFILYSVGQDFNDDDGKVVINNKGYVWRSDYDSGDTVFWPVSGR